MLDIKKIYEAKERIKDVVVDTPFSYAPDLSQMSGCEVFLKKENLQVTGAFKIRGAYNKIASLTSEQRACGVVAASAGNHAQGVALSASKFGIKAVIIMPESTPLTKVNGVKRFGAEVILAGANYDEAYAYATTYGQKNSLTFVHPFEDEEVIAGQGTVALDILESCGDLDAVLVPVGGGGLISGMASAIKSINSNIQVIGVSALGAPAFKNSYELGRAIDTTSVRTIADGIAVRDTSKITLEHALESVDKMVSVDDEEIASAILFLLERQKLVVEGAGSVGVAALLHNKLPELKGKKVAVVLSGGNTYVTCGATINAGGLTLTASASIGSGSVISSGSVLATGSIVSDGSILETNTYFQLDAATVTGTTTGDMTLKTGSVLEAGSIIANGSTLGVAVVTNADETVAAGQDMLLANGSSLAAGSVITAGTVLTSDILDDTNAYYNAGTTLEYDITTAGANALTADMILNEGSILASGSTLAINDASEASGTESSLTEGVSYRLSDVDVTSQEGAQIGIAVADAALKALDKVRSDLGSVQNQLVSTIANISTTRVNVTSAESSIRDVDFAEESSTFTKMQILSQTGTFALAQANASSQNVLSLLQ